MRCAERDGGGSEGRRWGKKKINHLALRGRTSRRVGRMVRTTGKEGGRRPGAGWQFDGQQGGRPAPCGLARMAGEEGGLRLAALQGRRGGWPARSAVGGGGMAAEPPCETGGLDSRVTHRPTRTQLAP